jgi:hypothetical protein
MSNKLVLAIFAACALILCIVACGRADDRSVLLDIAFVPRYDVTAGVTLPLCADFLFPDPSLVFSYFFVLRRPLSNYSLIGWLPNNTNSICTWEHVTCDQDGRVTRLDLFVRLSRNPLRPAKSDLIMCNYAT